MRAHTCTHRHTHTCTPQHPLPTAPTCPLFPHSLTHSPTHPRTLSASSAFPRALWPARHGTRAMYPRCHTPPPTCAQVPQLQLPIQGHCACAEADRAVHGQQGNRPRRGVRWRVGPSLPQPVVHTLDPTLERASLAGIQPPTLHLTFSFSCWMLMLMTLQPYISEPPPVVHTLGSLLVCHIDAVTYPRCLVGRLAPPMLSC